MKDEVVPEGNKAEGDEKQGKQKVGLWSQKLEAAFCTDFHCYLLWQHLGHVCGNTRSPVSSL